MFALARGCFELLIAWLLAFAGLYYVYEPRFSAPGPMWAAIIGGFFIASCWGLLRNAWQARSQAQLISESLDGAAPSPDQAYAAIGRAVALSEPLSTPFFKRPCVLYSYELSEEETVRVRTSKGTESQSRRTVYASGLAMTNWAVQTKYQPVRVCGFPVPDQFEETPVNLKQNPSRFHEFCEQTEFTRVGKWELGQDA